MLMILLLCCCSIAAAQDVEDGENPYEWGPGEIGECVDTAGLDSRYIGPSLYVIGSSLYEREISRSCFTKLTDLPIVVRDVESFWDRSVGRMLRFWSDDRVYRYHLAKGELEEVVAQGVIRPFLAAPIVGVAGRIRHSGCFGGNTEEIDHTPVDVEQAVPSMRDEVRVIAEAPRTRREINGVALEDLTWALRAVNADPYRVPTLEEFGIDEEALDLYREEIRDYDTAIAAAAAKKRGEEVNGEDIRWDLLTSWGRLGPDARSITHCRALPDMMAEVDANLVRTALRTHKDLYGSTSSVAYTIDLVNENGDTLRCSFETDGPYTPYCLPWTISYRGEEFQTYSIDLARHLMQLLPNADEWSEQEAKVDLLFAVAWQMSQE